MKITRYLKKEGFNEMQKHKDLELEANDDTMARRRRKKVTFFVTVPKRRGRSRRRRRVSFYAKW
jgi:predicted carbohydrate-binding protein with CBM5 and CBM33 domain